MKGMESALTTTGAEVLEVLDAFSARGTIDGRGDSPWDRLRVIVEAAAGDVFKSEERIAQTLIALSQVMAEDEVPVVAVGGSVFAPNVDGGLD